jgi:hypothetical protein
VTRIRTRLIQQPEEGLRHPFVSGVLCLLIAVLFLVVGVVGLVRGVWPQQGPYGGPAPYFATLFFCFLSAWLASGVSS